MALPYRLVRELENLKLSPAAVKVERARKPRLLCDHSWYPINETTISRAPQESMQFGGTLARILRSVRRANPRHGPTRLSKHDIKDGYYRNGPPPPQAPAPVQHTYNIITAPTAVNLN